MARTNLPVTALTVNATTAISTTAVDQANGMNIALASTAIPSVGNTDLLVLVVDNTAGAPHNFILRAGVNPPAFRKDLGDLTLAVGATTTLYIGPFDYARFVQTDGSLNIDFSASFAGTIQALLVPRSTN